MDEGARSERVHGVVSADASHAVFAHVTNGTDEFADDSGPGL
jgi:hypothetical protein